MLYEKLFSKLEKVRWSLEDDVQWKDINPEAVTPQQRETIRNICKTEVGSLFAAEAFIRDFYDDIDFSCFVSVWYYEEMKHCLVLKKYLKHLGIEIPEHELQSMRMSIPPSNKETILMIHFLSEHRLSMWYRGVSMWLKESVGQDIFDKIAADEVRHGQGYFEYIKKDLKQSPQNLVNYLRSALFMLSPKAPSDIHAVTITKTTDLLEDPHYITYLNDELSSDESRDATNSRIYKLLSMLAQEDIGSYKELSSLVRNLKRSA